jgi:hypothetical protein
MVITNTINKQIFDFTCPSEIVARELQNEIIYNTGPALTDVIDEVLTEVFSKFELFTIDKLEIDLAEITFENFGNDEMFVAFRQALQEKFTALINVETTVQNDRRLSISDANLNATLTFLSTGNLPWWVDKTAEIDCNEMLKSAIRERPEGLRKFLLENSNVPTVMTRLVQQFKAPAKEAIDFLVPGLLKKINQKRLLIDGEFEIDLEELPIGIIEKLNDVAEKPAGSIKEQKISNLVTLLRELQNIKWQNAFKVLNAFDSEEMQKLELFFSDKNIKKNGRKEAVRVLSKLTIFQIEFLLLNVAKIDEGKSLGREDDIFTPETAEYSSLSGKKTIYEDNRFAKPDIKEKISNESLQNDFHLEKSVTKSNSNTGVNSENSFEGEHESSDERTTEIEENKQIVGNKDVVPNSINSAGNIINQSERKDSIARISQVNDDSLSSRDNALKNGALINQQPVIEQGKESAKNNINTSESHISNKSNEAINGGINERNENHLDANEIYGDKHEELDKKENHDLPNEIKPLSTDGRNSNEIDSDRTSIQQHPPKDKDVGDILVLSSEKSSPDLLKTNIEKPTPGIADLTATFSKTTDSSEKFIEKVSKANISGNEDVGTLDSNNEVKEKERLLGKESFTNKEIETLSNSKIRDDNDVKRNSRLNYIQNKIGSSNEELYSQLYALSDQDLLILEKQFKQFEELDKRKRNLESIVQHPYLFKYNLLQILAGKYYLKSDRPDSTKKQVGGKEENKALLPILFNTIKSTQPALVNAINNLSVIEAIVLKDIAEKKIYETESEKQIIKKIIKKLPEKSVELLHFFTQLTEDEMQSFLTSCVKNVSVVDRYEQLSYTLDVDASQPEKIQIENAGLCLIATYFPALFRHLKYLEKDTFKNKAIATRALYLIQYITNGPSRHGEYLLQFNKLLCGFKPEEEIYTNIRLTKREKMEADDLLRSVIENWSTLKNTSINGFRTSFLQRRGIFTENEISWTLQVERRSYDMLLSTISWSFGIIKLPWMKKHIQVEW